MKKVWSLVLVLLSLQGKAQDFDSRKVNFGFTLSPSISWLNSKESAVENDGSKLGYSYGFMADIRFDDNYYFSTGISISQTGGKLKYKAGEGYSPNGTPTNAGSYDFKLQHVALPLSLKLKTNEINDINYWGQFGTYLGINMGARLNDGGQNLDKQRITSAIQPINMGLLLGIGAEFTLEGKTRGLVGLNFENGFIDATRNSKWNDGKMVINNLVLRMGVFF